MTHKKSTARSKPKATSTAPAKKTLPRSVSPESIDEFLSLLKHSLEVVEAIRRAILSVDASIHEGIKWNSLSFRAHEWFATLNLRGRNNDERVWLILHAGAKKGPDIRSALADADQRGLLKWLARDRALATFESLGDAKKKTPALKAIVRKWIRCIETR